jgi:catechol 2,3-dioxygenase-like lactoylglutathione lyase family enzyme
MKRMHIHIGVDDIATGISFYSALFGTDPVKIHSDHAKWMLEDPRLNFAISTRSAKGVDHLGLQVDNSAELEELRERMQAAQLSTFDEGETICCYARSNKSWVTDPSGVAWETFETMQDADVYSASVDDDASPCCTPETKGQPGCCEPSEKTAGCCA